MQVVAGQGEQAGIVAGRLDDAARPAGDPLGGRVQQDASLMFLGSAL